MSVIEFMGWLLQDQSNNFQIFLGKQPSGFKLKNTFKGF